MDRDTFYIAVERGNLETVRKGLESGLYDTTKTRPRHTSDLTSLHVACWAGQTDVAGLLMKHGANLEARDKHQKTPLHLAAEQGHTGTCDVLIKQGAAITVKDELQNTSLHGAAEQGHTETCELLIRSGADIMAVNVYEKTPLQLAAEHGHTGTCELLIRSGADVMATIKGGKSLLDSARDQKTRRYLKTVCKKMIQEKSYHELLQTSDGVRVNRCKVAICGGKETGKTTLKMSLQKGNLFAMFERLRPTVAERTEPTPGVDIGKFHVPGVGEVSMWDFAGQSEYVVTHSMFMDVENTVFIVLYSIMDDRKTQKTKVYWWLSFIKSCSPNRQPDVILVASHGDMVPVDQGQRNAAHLVHSLKAVFKDHLRIADEVILMDCRRTRTPEMGRLKTLLGSFKEALVEHQRDMPKLCAEIMKNLPKWSTTKTSYKFPVMKWPEYLDAVKEIDRFVTEDFLQQSTRFLHYLGEVLFITPSTCDPIVILAPNWLSTDIIGRMIVPENLEPQRKSPYVTKTEIQHVFQDVADVDLLITLLQEFQLCHSYDGQEFIFSWLLTETMPPYEWQTIPDPKARYFGKQVQCTDSTDMFSSGFFPRVQTRLMRELENRPKLWRDGAKCADRNVEGLIKLSPDGRAVNICVRSVQGDKVQCGKMLQQLENVVADVLDEWSPGTGAVEKVLSARALKEHTEEFHSYSHEVINKARTENSSIINPILGFKEQVKDLLCREDEDPLTKNRTELIQALRVVGPILDSLLSRGVLSVEECDIIRSKFTPHDRARMLLDILMTKGEEARLIFLCILKDVSPDVRLSTSKALKREVVKRKQQPCANQKFSKEEIVEMTKDSETNLAVGAFGTVYRAKLQCHHQMNGREVAIKVYSPGVDNQQGREELFQELAMRGSSHPHLLPLLGTCDVDGCLTLIYPYMKNRDLLLCIKDKCPLLNYQQRLLISMDLISAVRFYHTQCIGKVNKYHGDVKSTNVLLDENYRARLQGPGLMRDLPSDMAHLSHTGGSMSLNWTPHYRDPYYAETLKLHGTSDHYSAGKVLLELLTGLPANAADEYGKFLFSEWKYEPLAYFNKNSDGRGLCDVVDRSPGVDWPVVTDDGNSITQRFARLIIGCLLEDPNNRINLEELYEGLKILVSSAHALTSCGRVTPSLCTFCLVNKPCSIPMACGCVSVCVTCMKNHTTALYCQNRHTDTRGLGQNTFAILVGMKGRKKGEQGFGKDAKEMYKVLTDPNICAIRPENVRLLTDGKGTSENIKKAVVELGYEMKKVPETQERVFIYYHSGHGRSVHNSLKRYLVCEDKNISATQMRKLFKEICPTRSLYILDVCFASSVVLYTYKDDGQTVATNTEQRGSFLKLVTSLLPAWLTSFLRPWLSSKADEPEVEQSDDDGEDDANNTEKGSEMEEFLQSCVPRDSLLWASSRSYEPSRVEASAEDRVSVFTKYVLTGLRGGDTLLKQRAQAVGGIPLNFLQDYVYTKVTEELAGQTPSICGQAEKTYWMAYPPED
ncbi:uncharacterized protein [Branchiostoma lanceolatum]|uniref:uncharacterized protein isoform X2 n=1 Tax=Branchiostoma lanceolatum TaxID=7740 RepID=UPI0034548DF0